MSKSILQLNKECMLCKLVELSGERIILTDQGLHKHHVFYGTANRKKSEKHGLTVLLCQKHHQDSKIGVHHNRNVDLFVKQYAQSIFEDTHTREDFVKIFGKNYLGDAFEFPKKA